MTSAGNSDIFVSKLDSSGNFVWARQLGGIDTDCAYSVALGDDGNIFTTGYISGMADLDPGTGIFNLASAGATDIFISKLDPAGNFSGAWRIGSTSSDNGIFIIPGTQGSILTTGIFTGMVDFNLGQDNSYLTNVGGSDIYLAKYYLNAPTNIQLSSNNVQENLPLYTLVGVFSSTDSDPGDKFTFSFASGAGDTDNALFQIEGNQLKTNAIFDFETKSSYTIRVRTTDSTGLWFEKTFNINVTNQDDPPNTRIWDGGGADNLWMNPLNWLGDIAPLPGDYLLFPTNAARKDTVNNYAPQTAFQSILFIGAGYQLSGNAVLLTSGLIDSASGVDDNVVDFSAITLYAPQTFVNLHTAGNLIVQSNINLGNSTLNIDSSGTTRIEGDISGNAGIRKTGNGELTLTGINTYSGDTIVAGGEMYTGRIETNGQPTSKVEVQLNAKLQADAIITGTLTIGAGGIVTINPISGGPQGTLAANSALTPLATRALRPTSHKPIAQPTAVDTIVSASSTTTTIAAGPIAASMVLAATTTASSEVTSSLASSDSLSNTVLDAVATPTAIIADTALPVRLVESTPARRIDTAINPVINQLSIYSRLDSTALHRIIESRLENSLTTRNENITSTPIFGSLRDELPSRVEKIDKHRPTPAINSRQAHFAALQTNSRWSYLDAEVDFDIAQHVRAKKNTLSS